MKEQEPDISIRKGIAWIPRIAQPIWMHAVLVNGRTRAQFTSSSDAESYVRWLRTLPEYHHKSIHHNG